MLTNYQASAKRLDEHFGQYRPASPADTLESAAKQLTRLLRNASRGEDYVDPTDAGMVVQTIFEAAVIEACNRDAARARHVASWGNE